MNTTLYIIICWSMFLVLLYAYMFYDIYAEKIRLRDKWKRVIETFTEEE